MKIRFLMSWGKTSKNLHQILKNPGTQEAFEDYLKKIKPWVDVEWAAGFHLGTHEKLPSARLWLCERQKVGAKLQSSEQIAKKLEELQSLGIQRLDICIGGADGFEAAHLEQNKVDFLWSFGPMTLPHELALVLASEQVYRGFAILKNHPYHAGHTSRD